MSAGTLVATIETPCCACDVTTIDIADSTGTEATTRVACVECGATFELHLTIEPHLTFPVGDLLDHLEHATGLRRHKRSGCPCFESRDGSDSCLSLTVIARHLGVTARTVSRMIRAGTLTADQADRHAVALGTHPALIWDTWTQHA